MTMMKNYFYDLPDEIIDKIYKINIHQDLQDYEVVGHLWFRGRFDCDENEYNLYKNKFTIWNGFNFEWTGFDAYRMDDGDNYGTPDYPIEGSMELRKFWKSITPHEVVVMRVYGKIHLSVQPSTSSSCLRLVEPV